MSPPVVPTRVSAILSAAYTLLDAHKADMSVTDVGIFGSLSDKDRPARPYIKLDMDPPGLSPLLDNSKGRRGHAGLQVKIVANDFITALNIANMVKYYCENMPPVATEGGKPLGLLAKDPWMTHMPPVEPTTDANRYHMVDCFFGQIEYTNV